MKQKSGEPLDRWLVRLYDQGASQDLCNDPVVLASLFLNRT